MSGYCGQTYVIPKCPHGVIRVFTHCEACDVEAEAERIRYKRSVNDPAQRILDTIEDRRPWFRRCAFCAHSGEAEHDADCPWVAFLNRCPTCGAPVPSGGGQ